MLVASRLFGSKERAAGLAWLRAGFLLFAIVLGIIHTWAAISSDSMNADGIAYLDVADAYLRQDWSTAINPVWSPLYSWVLAVALAIFRPTMFQEFGLVHLVNLAIYIVALLSFELFWRQLDAWRQLRAAHSVALPAWAWWSLGYTLFIWISLSLIELWAVTPDMLTAALIFLAAALIVRLRLQGGRWLWFLLLGLVLGLAYLSKAIMFPLAFVFLAVALLTAPNWRQALPRVLAALVVFLLAGGPYIAAISQAQGHFTFSEAGTLTYLRHVNGIPYPHWQGGTPGFGTPEHPSRRILDNPPVYEFGEPIGGTYPISYNPAYWYSGATIPFNVTQQLQALLNNGLYYFDLFFRQQGVLLFGVILFYLLSRSRTQLSFTWLLDNARRWGLLFPALAAFGLYAIVYAEGRYLGAFVLLFWSDLLANARLPEQAPLTEQASRHLMNLVTLLMVGFLLANVVAFNLEGYGRLSVQGAPAQAAAPAPRPVEVAQVLWQLGLEPGDRVGVIGYGFDSFWARLARVKIVAEMFEWEAGDMWRDPAQQREVLQAFAATGAGAIVAEYVPASASLPGWRQVGGSSYYIYLLEDGQ